MRYMHLARFWAWFGSLRKGLVSRCPDAHGGQLIRGEQEKHRVFDVKSRKSSGFGDTYHM